MLILSYPSFWEKMLSLLGPSAGDGSGKQEPEVLVGW